MFLSYFIHHRFLEYLIIFVAIIIEGDATLFTAFFLVHRRLLDLGDAFLVTTLGAIAGDVMWYYLGKKISARSPFFSLLIKHATEYFDEHLTKNTLRTVFISKFAYGLNHAIIMRAGMLGIEFWKFFKSNVFAIILWVIVVGSFGYFAGLYYVFIRHAFKFFEFGLMISILVFVIFAKAVSKGVKKIL